jgi:hypothetical protein
MKTTSMKICKIVLLYCIAKQIFNCAFDVKTKFINKRLEENMKSLEKYKHCRICPKIFIGTGELSFGKHNPKG